MNWKRWPVLSLQRTCLPLSWRRSSHSPLCTHTRSSTFLQTWQRNFNPPKSRLEDTIILIETDFLTVQTEPWPLSAGFLLATGFQDTEGKLSCLLWQQWAGFWPGRDQPSIKLKASATGFHQPRPSLVLGSLSSLQAPEKAELKVTVLMKWGDGQSHIHTRFHSLSYGVEETFSWTEWLWHVASLLRIPRVFVLRGNDSQRDVQSDSMHQPLRR